MPTLPEDGAPNARTAAVPMLPVHGSTTAAIALREALLAGEPGAPVAIDASAVESVGQAVIQLLLAACGDARERGSAFQIVNPSDAFVARIRACGLDAALGLA